MSDKRWTYKQITDNAEAQIRQAAELAVKSPDLAYLFRAQARGIYDMWYSLVTGWIEADDIARLRALTEISLEPQTANRS